jgi:probable addiction module antidote protein
MPKTKLAPYQKRRLVAKYLAVAARDPDPEAFVMAIAAMAKAIGMSRLAESSGLGRESLYKALARGSRPRYETVRKLVEAFGLHLTVKTQGSAVRSRLLRRAARRAEGGGRQLVRRRRSKKDLAAGAKWPSARSAVWLPA